MKQKTDIICPKCNKEYLNKEQWTDDLGFRYSCGNCGYTEYRKRRFA